MPIEKPDGGTVSPAGIAMALRSFPRSVFAVIPVPKAPPKPEPFLVESMNEVLEGLAIKVNLKLEDEKGNTQGETLLISEMEKFTEEGLIETSPTMRKLEQKKDFLSELHDAMTGNPDFQIDLDDLLDNPDRKKAMVEYLSAIAKAYAEDRPKDMLINFLENIIIE